MCNENTSYRDDDSQLFPVSEGIDFLGYVIYSSKHVELRKRIKLKMARKPTDEEIKAAVIGWYNQQTDPVWLSSENQFNYKAAYDLAVQSNGTTLPVKFKFGTDEQPKYRVFERLEELADFYTKAMRFIQDTLDAGWQKKDAFNPEDYRDE